MCMQLSETKRLLNKTSICWKKDKNEGYKSYLVLYLFPPAD
jgi:hypothetical protein